MKIILKKKATPVKAFTNSERAKAEIKATIAKDKKAKALQDQSPLKSRDHIKGFWRQYPKAKALFGLIMNVWRQSTAIRPSTSGCWAAYPYSWWSEKAKMPERTLKRHLDHLETYGLIERERGQHSGKRVLSFIRPTALALSLSDNRPGDWGHLGIGLPKAPTKAAPEISAPAQAAPEPEEEGPQTYKELLALINDDDDTPKPLSH